MSPASFFRFLVLAATVGGAAACYGSGDATLSAPAPLFPGPSTYVAKVKNLLVGLPPTDDEVEAVRVDPASLSGLIDGWMALPQYEQKMRTFFELAFQQAQVAGVDLDVQSYPKKLVPNPALEAQLAQNARESFARTALAIVRERRPFTETMTTQRFMMTPALMEAYAFLDAWQVDDADKVSDGFAKANPGLTITVSAASGPIPVAESLDPASPNYMHWYNPDVVNAGVNQPPWCAQDPIVYPASAVTLHYVLIGTLQNRKNPVAGQACGQRGGDAHTTRMIPSDYSAWRMVTIRQPRAGESTTPFYDLEKLRGGAELVLATPRVGFFTTPAFFANWPTNKSNQARVTMNQALIVALGAAVDGSDPTAPPETPGLDATHAAKPECFSCHQTLDPTRSILSSTYSWSYHRQTEATFAAEKGLFSFRGVTRPVASVADLGKALAEHPLFAAAWVQKLCYYASSAACSPDDPEFLRVVGVFRSAGFDWNALVRELLASPLTTHATRTKSSDEAGEVIAVARRDHLCAALNGRLGLTDVCGLDTISTKGAPTTIPQIVSGLPSDGYGRGAIAPVLPNAPSLFFRAGMENICEAASALVIDAPSPVPGSRQWSSGAPDAAIADFVHVMMALPDSDARAAAARDALTAHFGAAKQQGASASDALKSTFVVSCLAPSALAVGL